MQTSFQKKQACGDEEVRLWGSRESVWIESSGYIAPSKFRRKEKKMIFHT